MRVCLPADAEGYETLRRSACDGVKLKQKMIYKQQGQEMGSFDIGFALLNGFF